MRHSATAVLLHFFLTLHLPIPLSCFEYREMGDIKLQSEKAGGEGKKQIAALHLGLAACRAGFPVEGHGFPIRYEVIYAKRGAYPTLQPSMRLDTESFDASLQASTRSH